MTDPRLGGPQIRALAVAEELRDVGIETEFLIPNGTTEFEERAEERGFVVHRPGLTRMKPPSDVIGNTIHLVKFPISTARIARVISNRSIDVVHANMSTNFESALAAYLSDAGLVWHFNDTQMPGPLVRMAKKGGETLADTVVVAANSVGDYYFENSRVDPMPLYAPVDVDKFDPKTTQKAGLREEMGISQDTILIGTVGNLNPIKGHSHLIEAADRVTSELDCEIKFLIAGKILDSRRDYYQSLVQLRSERGLDKTVRFLGHREDIPGVLRDIDLFVLPSLAEACPMAVLEAMAMEKPIVASSVGGVPELLSEGETGWLVPPRKPDALADAMVEAIRNESEARSRGKNARETAVEQFSLEQCVERHIEVYRRVKSDGSV